MDPFLGALLLCKTVFPEHIAPELLHSCIQEYGSCIESTNNSPEYCLEDLEEWVEGKMCDVLLALDG
jgi:hypothetical protein